MQRLAEGEDHEEDDSSPFHWMEGDSLAPPCQTDREVISALLTLLEPFASQASTLLDLGCGDGRVCLAASRAFDCKSIGVEIEETLVERFRRNLSKEEEGPAELKDLVTIVHGDLLEVDLEAASIIVLYLLPEAVALIAERLKAALRKGKVVVCNSWGLKDLVPHQKTVCGPANNVVLYLYTRDCLPPLPHNIT